ncbi:MAG: metallophosphoesterase [Pseudomonadota bacterium]
MKCLLVADLHYDLRKFDWVVEAAAHMDVVVLAGDHLDLASAVARPAQAIVVEKYFRRIRERAPLLVCSGNHDLDSRDAVGELTSKWLGKARLYDVPTDGDAYTIGDTLFSVCPWWDGEHGRAAVAAQLARDAADRQSRWVWVYHAPPGDSPTSWAGSRSFGDPALRDWIERYEPDIVLCGHVHQSPFTNGGSWADRIGHTWVFNAGHQIGPLPAHIVVDTDEPEAYWISLAGAEQVHLDDAAKVEIEPIMDAPDWLIDMPRVA